MVTAPALPGLLLLTNRRLSRRPLPATVGAAVSAGARAVVLREKDLPERERAVLAGQLAEILAPVDGLLILACTGTGTGVGAATAGRLTTGVHLAAKDPAPAPGRAIVGRSCHDAAELDAAAAEGLDYVTVSPVFATTSKPGYGPALGVAALRALCRRSRTPVHALGGVTAANAGECVAAGAAGVAVMGGVMRAEDPATTTAELLAALSDAAGRLASDPAEPASGTWRARSGAAGPDRIGL